ncbi:MAG TPA: hypothetical protein VGS20_03720 [Candidatus Acidoferrales bacterium]|nr:hypothetical protein [Candidatus Acidoferrales bacterium]
MLLALFIGALMIIAAAVAVPSLITQNRRQKEALMIWRGQQYARAIGLFYRKTGRFPHDLDELEHGVGNVHFLRKAYKDPMNTEDGSWRLIYLGPGGQLIGSLRWHTMAEYQAAEMGLPLPTAGAGNPNSGPTGPAGAATPSGVQPSGANPQPSAPPSPTKPQPSPSTSSQPQTQTIEEGQMAGGNLIGVASKVKQNSLKTYLGGTTYRQWEFLWNPLEGQTNGVIAPAGVSPTGQQPNAPNSPVPFGKPEPPGAAIPPGPGLSPPNPQR